MLNSELLDKLDALQVKLQSSINFLQFEYYRKISKKKKKISDPSTSPKCYWTRLKTLLNGRIIPCIAPHLHDNKFITDFKEKSKIFNSFFGKQCSLIDNGSTLLSLFPLITGKSLSDVDFLVEQIKISKPDSNKAHSDNMIFIFLLQLCDKFICKSLNIIFKSCLTQGIFQSEWKKANVAPIHKKKTSSVLKTADMPLLPICSKVLQHIIFLTIFTYFIKNNLISKNTSGFKCFISHYSRNIFQFWWQLQS